MSFEFSCNKQDSVLAAIATHEQAGDSWRPSLDSKWISTKTGQQIDSLSAPKKHSAQPFGPIHI